MTCPRCNGTRRIPWPEAGMMQDCPCVRTTDAARPPTDATIPPILIDFSADPWALPEGLSWWYDSAVAWWSIIADRAGSLWLGIGEQRAYGALTSRPDAPALIVLLRRRNAAAP